jgi:hypothetical protein
VATAKPFDRCRTLVRSVLLPEDQILLIDGQTEGERVTASVISLHGGGVRPLAPMPAARSLQTVPRLPHGRILIVGGDKIDTGPVSPALI